MVISWVLGVCHHCIFDSHAQKCPKHTSKVQHPPAVKEHFNKKHCTLLVGAVVFQDLFGTSGALFAQLPNMRSFSIRQHQRMGIVGHILKNY